MSNPFLPPPSYYPELAPNQDEIRRLAYELYLQNGCRGEDSFQHWLEAEAWVKSRSVGVVDGVWA